MDNTNSFDFLLDLIESDLVTVSDDELEYELVVINDN